MKYRRSEYDDRIWCWIEFTYNDVQAFLPQASGDWTPWDKLLRGLDSWKEVTDTFVITTSYMGFPEFYTRIQEEYPSLHFIPSIKQTSYTGTDDYYTPSDWADYAAHMQETCSLTGANQFVTETERATNYLIRDNGTFYTWTEYVNNFQDTSALADCAAELPSDIECIWYRVGSANTAEDEDNRARILNDLFSTIHDNAPGSITPIPLHLTHPGNINNSYAQSVANSLESITGGSRANWWPMVWFQTTTVGCRNHPSGSRSNGDLYWLAPPLDADTVFANLESNNRAIMYPGLTSFFFGDGARIAESLRQHLHADSIWTNFRR